jgi:diadenosine tetraphosphate (Ap4A) HIT family hydrolase
MPTANCDLCNEFSGKLPNIFETIYGSDPKSRVLFRSNDFVVVPSLGQITEGHLLLLPLEHRTALGDLPESLLEDLTTLSGSVAAILREEYGSCITFEHGVRPGDSGGCGISHAHLHAVPFSEALDPFDILKSTFSYKRIEDLNEIKEQSAGLSGYLFYQDAHSRAHLFNAPNLISQYMRKLLVELQGADDWDWRSAGKEDRLLATLNRLSNRFEAITIFRESQARYGNAQ